MSVTQAIQPHHALQKILADWLVSGQPLDTEAHTITLMAYYDESHLAKECLEFANASEDLG